VAAAVAVDYICWFLQTAASKEIFGVKSLEEITLPSGFFSRVFVPFSSLSHLSHGCSFSN
jgi:hypothetical protein